MWRLFLLLISLFVTTASFLAPAHAVQPSAIEAKYQDLLLQNDCGDEPCALKLKKKGEWKAPSAHALNLVEKNRETLLDVAKKFAINPLAIAAVLVSENTINVQWDDKLQNAAAWLLNLHFGKNRGELLLMLLGDLFDHPVSVGPAQINSRGLDQAITEIKKLEVEDHLDASDLKGNIVTFGPDKTVAIHLIAALLRDAQDEYAKQGMDISQNIGVLATLYNLGNPAARAKNTAELHQAPSVNFIGLFAEKYKQQIKDALYQ